jgi:trimethylamine corrinoid protein
MMPSLAGASNIYGAGMLELGMSFSLEQLVIDNDVIGMFRYAKNGVEVNDGTLAYKSIREVGIGNNFLDYEDTMQHMDLPSKPAVIDRRMFDPWAADGKKDTVDLAHEIVMRILEAPVVSPLSSEAEAAIDAIIAKKLKELEEENANKVEEVHEYKKNEQVSEAAVASVKYETKDIGEEAQAAFIKRAYDAVVSYNAKEAKAVADEAVAAGADLLSLIQKGYTEGINAVGAKYEAKEVFLPQMMASAKAMDMGMEVLTPYIGSSSNSEGLGKIIMCTIEGDIHSIGKDIAAILMKVAGFEVINLGKDVLVTDIVQAVIDNDAVAVGTSALMTSTMINQKTLEDALRSAGIREGLVTNVGGAPVTQGWADEIGADIYAETATEAANKMASAMAD